MEDILIKPASLLDLGGLYRLEPACFEEDSWPWVDLVSVLMMPGIVRLKAAAGDCMVGFVAGDGRGPGKMGWITTLGVLPEYRRQGIAPALLQACETGLGLPVIRLCVRRSNLPAIRLYEKEAYRRVDVWARYYNGKEDAVVMEKRMESG